MIIKALDLTKIRWYLIQIQTTSIFIIVLFFLIGLTRRDGVNFCGWGKVLPVLGVLSALLFSRFLNDLGLLLKSQFFRLLGFGPRLSHLKVFHKSALRVAFVVRSVAILAPLLYFSEKWNGLESYFGLRIDRFLNYICLAV